MIPLPWYAPSQLNGHKASNVHRSMIPLYKITRSRHNAVWGFCTDLSKRNSYVSIVTKIIFNFISFLSDTLKWNHIHILHDYKLCGALLNHFDNKSSASIYVHSHHSADPTSITVLRNAKMSNGNATGYHQRTLSFWIKKFYFFDLLKAHRLNCIRVISGLLTNLNITQSANP